MAWQLYSESPGPTPRPGCTATAPVKKQIIFREGGARFLIFEAHLFFVKNKNSEFEHTWIS